MGRKKRNFVYRYFTLNDDKKTSICDIPGCNKTLVMMACSYLSTAGMSTEASGAACWTPPALGMPPEMEGPSTMQPPMYLRPHAPLTLPTAPPTVCPGPSQEPALDLTTSATLKSRLPSPPSDDEAE